MLSYEKTKKTFLRLIILFLLENKKCIPNTWTHFLRGLLSFLGGCTFRHFLEDDKFDFFIPISSKIILFSLNLIYWQHF